MLLKISRTEAESNNQLLVSVNRHPQYVVITQPPLKTIVSDLAGNFGISASLSPSANIFGRIIPKWLFGGKSKSYVHTVYDENDNVIGSFYRAQTGLQKRKLVVDCGVKLDCYTQSYGTTTNTFILKDGAQIAEIVLPLSTAGGFWCYIYLLDEYSWLDKLLSIIASSRPTHTKGGHSKLHDREWLVRNFNSADIKEMNDEIIKNEEFVSGRG